MNFKELINSVNALDINNKNEINNIVKEIDINENNIDYWIDNVFSDEVFSFDMGKLPYLIDCLYQTDDKLLFLLCCILIEATCEELEFITNLENYPIFKEKYKSFIHTLITVYDRVDNGIANCMALIMLNSDPTFSLLHEDDKNIITKATIRKLEAIIKYLRTSDINNEIYDMLEIIIDLSCYLYDEEIKNLIIEFDALIDNKYVDVFIIKYKIINNISVSINKLNILKNDEEMIWPLYRMMENLNIHHQYLNDITQEKIAKAEIIRWLKYPTELGSNPDAIELLGDLIFEGNRAYIYKFTKEDYKKGDMLGVAGTYPLDEITSYSYGYTFSNFELLDNDWQAQALALINQIHSYWQNRSQT